MSTYDRINSHGRLARLLDIILAATCLVLCAPLFLLLSLAVLAEVGRPILFVQTRIGRGGHSFRMYKFRKFRSCSESGCPLTLKNDRRMSRVGRLLAQTKLDELPQLVNILRGDMAVVGPRPESLAFADCFTATAMPVLSERPGIFGPSQVAFRNESALYPPGVDPVHFYRQTLFPAKAALDTSYYPNRTLASDMGWMVRGVLAVLGIGRARVIKPPAGDGAGRAFDQVIAAE